MRKKTIILLVIFTLFVFTGKSIMAADIGGLGIFPAYYDTQNPQSESWFIYNLVSGEEKKDTLLIRNSSNKTLSAKIYSADGTTTADGAFTLEGVHEKKDGLGAWVKLPIETVTVSPGEEKKIDFTIHVPGNASVGDHTGGILLENIDAQAGKGVNVVTRVGVRIYETVPGLLIRKLKITDFSWKLVNDKVVFYFSLANEGNTQLTPSGKLNYQNSFYGGNGNFDMNLGTILQGKPTKVPITWVNAPLIGQVKAKAVVNFGTGANDKLEREISFMYITNKAKIISAVIIAFVIFLFLLPRLKKRKK